jgi:hypothetical protein
MRFLLEPVNGMDVPLMAVDGDEKYVFWKKIIKSPLDTGSAEVCCRMMVSMVGLVMAG